MIGELILKLPKRQMEELFGRLRRSIGLCGELTVISHPIGASRASV